MEMNIQSGTVWKLVLKNLAHRKRRTLCLVCIVALLVFTTLAGTLLVSGVRNGLRSATERMGAEILVVPEGYDEEVEGLLLRSEQGSFYFSDALISEIERIAGVEKITSQLYIQSMNAACCSVPVQLIAYEPDTDFVITPWIYDKIHSDVGFLDVVCGSLIEAQAGDQITLFGQTLDVVAMLDETATGFDSSIFMTRQTAEELIKRSAETSVKKLEIAPDEISCILINSVSSVSPEILGNEIKSQIDGVDVVSTDSMLGDVSDQVNQIANVIYGVIALIWVMSTLLTVIVFLFSVNERSKEFGIYRVLGFSRSAIRMLLVREVFLVCVLGWTSSALICSMIIFPFKSLVSYAMEIPYLMPNDIEIIIYYLISLVLTMITGLISCIVSLKRISAIDVFHLIKENE